VYPVKIKVPYWSLYATCPDVNKPLAVKICICTDEPQADRAPNDVKRQVPAL
jgi:hypothetical protein